MWYPWGAAACGCAVLRSATMVGLKKMSAIGRENSASTAVVASEQHSRAVSLLGCSHQAPAQAYFFFFRPSSSVVRPYRWLGQHVVSSTDRCACTGPPVCAGVHTATPARTGLSTSSRNQRCFPPEANRRAVRMRWATEFGRWLHRTHSETGLSTSLRNRRRSLPRLAVVSCVLRRDGRQ